MIGREYVPENRWVCCPDCGRNFKAPPLHRDAWTREDKSTLLELHESGFTFDQIAKRMGRSRNSIAGKCRRLGLTQD